MVWIPIQKGNITLVKLKSGISSLFIISSFFWGRETYPQVKPGCMWNAKLIATKSSVFQLYFEHVASYFKVSEYWIKSRHYSNQNRKSGGWLWANLRMQIAKANYKVEVIASESNRWTQQTFTCSKVTIKTREWRRSGVFIVNFEQILHSDLVFPSLTLSK